MGDSADIRVEALPSTRLEELEPIWNALREHHSRTGPRWLGPPRERVDSWIRRRRQYEQWLTADADAFVLVARQNDHAVGYAMVHVRAGSPTWPISERSGEIESLSVLPDQRGRGVGRLLLRAIFAELRRRGAKEVGLHVVQGNEDARRFYARDGFRSFATWLSAPIP